MHECYVKHWVEYAYGRPEHDADEALITRVGRRSLEEGASIKDLIIGLVKTEAFLTRSAEEL